MRSLLFAVALAATGCGDPSPPPMTDAATARIALIRVLDTWKRGGTTADLLADARPITARDADWAAGCKLTAFEVSPEDGRTGTDLLVAVKLTMTRPDGRPQTKTVNYIVGIAGVTAVLRAE